MSYGQAELYTLLTDSTITDLLTQGEDGIFYDTVIPLNVGGVTVGAEDSTINYYRVGPVNGGLDYLDVDYSINCRAPTQKEAEDIAVAVKAVVNRRYGNGYGFRVSALPVIPPFNDVDLYNAPLDVKVWGRTFD
jgi:hypothetical protein